jgi:hypothetical protein
VNVTHEERKRGHEDFLRRCASLASRAVAFDRETVVAADEEERSRR